MDAAFSTPLDRGTSMRTQNFDPDDQVLAEFRFATVKAKLKQFDIEAVASALTLRVVTTDKGAQFFWAQAIGLSVHVAAGIEANCALPMGSEVQP
jgi:hypothetical protein